MTISLHKEATEGPTGSTGLGPRTVVARRRDAAWGLLDGPGREEVPRMGGVGLLPGGSPTGP